ncbi:MAG: hypothetical protein WCK54_08330 [Desulfuromonadales bacterium]
MLCYDRSRPEQIIAKRFIRPAIPFLNKEMIIKQIDHYSAIQTVVRVYAPSALLKQLRTTGEGINPAVQVNAVPNAHGKSFRQRSFDKISHKVADQNLVIVTGKQHVKEEVHGVGSSYELQLRVDNVRNEK